MWGCVTGPELSSACTGFARARGRGKASGASCARLLALPLLTQGSGAPENIPSQPAKAASSDSHMLQLCRQTFELVFSPRCSSAGEFCVNHVLWTWCVLCHGVQICYGLTALLGHHEMLFSPQHRTQNPTPKTQHPKAGGRKRTHVPEFLSTGKSGQENSSFFTLKRDSLFQEDGGESTRRCSWFPRFVVF